MEQQNPIQLLVQKAREGDEPSFGELSRRYRGRIEAVARVRLGELLRGALDVEDIVQETFLRAYRSLADFAWQGEEEFFRWLVSISSHVIHEQAKRHKRRKASTLEHDVAANDLSQSKAQRREERFDRLENAVKALSEDHRQVILLARIERLPLKQVAERMHRSRPAVRQLLWRALQELKAVFGETESLHLPPRSLDEKGEHDA